MTRRRVRSIEYRTRRAARHARHLDAATTALTEFYAAAGAGPSLPPVPDALAAALELAAKTQGDVCIHVYRVEPEGGQSQTTA